MTVIELFDRYDLNPLNELTIERAMSKSYSQFITDSKVVFQSNFKKLNRDFGVRENWGALSCPCQILKKLEILQKLIS